MGKLKDLVGLGSPIVDLSSYGTDEFLREYGLVKGSMTLVDLDTITRLQEAVNISLETSGGSAANTIVGFSLLGGSSSYIGKINNDRMGHIFRSDLESSYVALHNGRYTQDSSTSRCLVIITPEGERTMATYLGASIELHETDIVPEVISDHSVIYIEGYLFDVPDSIRAVVKACDIAKSNGRSIALSLSDSYCVDRNRNSFKDFIDSYVDILFSNEAEIISLHNAQDVNTAIRQSTGICKTVVTTLGQQGSLISGPGNAYVIDPVIVDEVVDTNGAGDLYASGFLYGLTHGYDLGLCGRLGSMSASQIISHMGARPTIGFRERVHNILGGNKV